jgi:hypothetical protein
LIRPILVSGGRGRDPGNGAAGPARQRFLFDNVV